MQVLDLIDWQKLQVTALDLSGWQLGLAGWERLAGKVQQANAMRKLVLSNCDISTDPGALTAALV